MRAVVGIAGILGIFGLIATPRVARAQVVDGGATTLIDAERDFDDASRAFAATGTDCVIMCKALQSMARAAERICALAPPDDEPAQEKCVAAREKVAEATKKIQAACPGCKAIPGGAPDEAATKPPGPPPSVNEEGASIGAPVATLAAGELDEAHEGRPIRHVTVAVSPIALLAPPFLVEGHVEAYVGGLLSLVARGGIGRMRDEHDSANSTVWRVGGALRAYFGGGFDGAFLGIEGNYDHTENPVQWLHFVPGFTFGPVLGFKHVARSGFTLETQLGVADVAVDHRDATDPRPSVIPTFDLAVGYSF